MILRLLCLSLALGVASWKQERVACTDGSHCADGVCPLSGKCIPFIWKNRRLEPILSSLFFQEIDCTDGSQCADGGCPPSGKCLLAKDPFDQKKPDSWESIWSQIAKLQEIDCTDGSQCADGVCPPSGKCIPAKNPFEEGRNSDGWKNSDWSKEKLKKIMVETFISFMETFGWPYDRKPIARKPESVSIADWLEGVNESLGWENDEQTKLETKPESVKPGSISDCLGEARENLVRENEKQWVNQNWRKKEWRRALGWLDTYLDSKFDHEANWKFLKKAFEILTGQSKN